MSKKYSLDELKQIVVGDMLGHVHEKDISRIVKKIEEMKDDIIFAFIAKYGFDVDNPTTIEHSSKMIDGSFITEIAIKNKQSNRH